jgi:predicted nucleic acid-binding protein
MPPNPRAIVFDSWAVIAFLEGEPAGEKIADIIADAHENGTLLMMSVVNAGEVWYILARAASEHEADKGIDELRGLGITFVDADWNLTHAAARFKGKYKMSFADAFAAALARQEKGAVLLTGDAEFAQAEGDVMILWVKN